MELKEAKSSNKMYLKIKNAISADGHLRLYCTGLDYTTPLHIHKSPYVRIFYGGTEQMSSFTTVLRCTIWYYTERLKPFENLDTVSDVN